MVTTQNGTGKLTANRQAIRIERGLDNLLQKRCGLSTRQYEALDLINQGHNSSSIARETGVAPTVVTGVIDRLVRDGRVIRTYPQEGNLDRRTNLLTLTERGQTVLAEAEELIGGFTL